MLAEHRGQAVVGGTVIGGASSVNQAPIQNLADRFTIWFLPTVVVLAIVAFFVTGDVKAAVSVLLVACPCAFAIATPILRSRPEYRTWPSGPF